MEDKYHQHLGGCSSLAMWVTTCGWNYIVKSEKHWALIFLPGWCYLEGEAPTEKKTEAPTVWQFWSFTQWKKTSLKILKILVNYGREWIPIPCFDFLFVRVFSVFFFEMQTCHVTTMGSPKSPGSVTIAIRYTSSPLQPPLRVSQGWSTQRKMSQFVARMLGAQRSWRTGCCCWDGTKNGFGKSYTECKIIMASQPTPPNVPTQK